MYIVTNNVVGTLTVDRKISLLPGQSIEVKAITPQLKDMAARNIIKLQFISQK
jgi:hypothetical protein